MIDITKASKILEVYESDLSEFIVIDEFNNNNKLSGFICRKSDYRYGCLLITSVNDVECYQIVYCTPKLHYPFDKKGIFHWPKIEKIQVWDKLDGTNVFCYWYRDDNGNNCYTFKTRLTPLIKDCKFGGFKSMWIEYIHDNVWVGEVIRQNKNIGLSFEMYGSRNPITIKYNVSLEVALLFGINNKGEVVPITKIKNKFNNIKLPEKYGNIVKANGSDSIGDFTNFYNDYRNEMSKKIKENGYLSVEGVVLYAFTEGYWKMFKCKPEEIENIHWTASGSIPKISIWNTIQNAYENTDDPTIEFINKLLLEEYDEHLITKNTIRIQNIFYEVKEHMKFVAIVNSAWQKANENGFDIKKDKNATMKFLSQFFDKKEMRKVGTVILKQAGLLK